MYHVIITHIVGYKGTSHAVRMFRWSVRQGPLGGGVFGQSRFFVGDLKPVGPMLIWLIDQIFLFVLFFKL